MRVQKVFESEFSSVVRFDDGSGFGFLGVDKHAFDRKDSQWFWEAVCRCERMYGEAYSRFMSCARKAEDPFKLDSGVSDIKEAMSDMLAMSRIVRRCQAVVDYLAG